MAVVIAFLKMFMLVLVGLYIYTSLCFYLIAKKLNVENAWLAWIPLVQIAVFIQSAGKSLLWFLLFFIPFVNIIVITYLWMCVAENLGKNKLIGLLTLIPVVNFIVMGMLAFSKQEGGQGATPVPSA